MTHMIPRKSHEIPAPLRQSPHAAAFILILWAVLLSACATSVKWDYQRAPSTAWTHPEGTSVGALIKEAADQHPGLSGFYPIFQGRDAFLARVAMADLAEKTLDAQYYIWEADTTGRILAERMVRAADRGVRVRLLIDDIYQKHATDFNVAILASHPNIEIRLFNPLRGRRWRTLSFLSGFSRVNHRMHNKLFVMDNALGIVGGRNIADEYFGVRADHNFRDMEVLSAGPIVRDLSASFDEFWNSEWAVPVSAVVKKKPTEQDLRAAMNRLKANIAAAGYPYPIDPKVEDLRARLIQIRDGLTWAPGKVYFEHPSRVTARGDTENTEVIHQALFKRVTEVEREILIESPYFILTERGVENAGKLTARGVKVRVLTNSAATNDEMAAFAGYANTRKQLLKGGVDLYELRPDSNMPRRWAVLAGQSRAALHAKSIVFDRKSVFFGSYNLDPRSTRLNTEIGVLIDSPKLAGQVAAFMEGGVTPGSAFHLTLDKKNHLVWTDETDGQRMEYHKDPKIRFRQRFVVGILRMLPIEKYL